MAIKVGAEAEASYIISAQDVSAEAIAKAKAGLTGLEGHSKTTADKMKSQWDGLKNSWALMTAGIASALYIFNQLKSYASYFTGAYLEQEKAENRLTIAMKNMGDYSIVAHKALANFASELQRTTAIGDEATLGVMTLLKTFGMSDDVLKKTTASVLDLSVGLEIDLQTAAKMMGKAFVGETGTLGRFGIKVDETKVGVERFNDILTQVQQRFGGFAQAELDTYSGRWKNLSNMIKDAAEKIGKFFLDMTHGGPLIDRQTQALQRNNEVLMNTESGYMRFTNEISPKVLEELRKEADAWNAFTSTVSKFKPVADETLKAIEKIATELEKIGIERKFVGGDEFAKRKAMLELERKAYEKAGVDEYAIREVVAKKTEFIEAERQEAFRKMREKGVEDYAASLAKNAEAEDDARNAAIQTYTMSAALRESIEERSADALAESWGKYYEAQEEALHQWGLQVAEEMGNWGEINLKTQMDNLNSWDIYYDELQEREKSIAEYQIERAKIGREPLVFLTAEGEALIKNAESYGILTASLMQYNVAQELYLGLQNAVRGALVSAILGYESFGKAIAKATAAALASIAAECAVRALFNTAYGFYCLATYQYPAAVAAFKAAAFFAACAVLAGAAARVMMTAAGGPTPGERAGREAETGAGTVPPVAPTAVEERPVIVNIHVYGSIHSEDELARILVPALKKASSDGVR